MCEAEIMCLLVNNSPVAPHERLILLRLFRALPQHTTVPFISLLTICSTCSITLDMGAEMFPGTSDAAAAAAAAAVHSVTGHPH